MTAASIENNLLALDWVSYIHYLILFKEEEVQAPINSGIVFNAIKLVYSLKLGLKILCTNVGAQKIDDSIVKIFEIVITIFQIEDNLDLTQYFQETFLSADINMEIFLEIFFIISSNTNIQFAKK